MHIFVTGGSGFVGRHLLRALADAGHRTTALARSDSAASVVAGLGAEVVRGDLGDRDALSTGMVGCDAVVHVAAVTDQWGAPERFDAVNVAGTSAVVETARGAGVARLVHVSTEAVLADGAPLVRVDETHPRPKRPVGEYARTKGLAEDLVLAANAPGFTTIAVRPRFVWGPEDTTILPALIDAVNSGKYAWVSGGHYLTSTCHVANLCAGILCALDRGRGGQAYFLTDGEPVDQREFIVALAATAGVRLPDRSLPRGLVQIVARAGEGVWRVLRLAGEPPVTRTFLALSAQQMTVEDGLARAELAYRPKITREEGLTRLAETSALE